MIQRIQSIFFLLSALASLLIIFIAPVLSNEDGLYYLYNDFPYLRLLLFVSAFISIYAIFQYKNRSKQRLLSSLSRLMITFFYLVVLLVYREKFNFESGLFLCIIPFLLLFLASFFIKKDEKLIKDADRIR
jgi:peptidoglycan/LPS O-acetylase OafA/YrhL|tara:strand:+ start:290 stop:682 length:393 start_codon:yes stop_codon:yes gene_type:complete